MLNFTTRVALVTLVPVLLRSEAWELLEGTVSRQGADGAAEPVPALALQTALALALCSGVTSALQCGRPLPRCSAAAASRAGRAG